MGRGVGTTGIFKEARLAASVEILNKLAMSCYILKVTRPVSHKLLY